MRDGARDDASVGRFSRDLERLVRHARACDAPGAEHRLALAVSGGPDSMAMLALAAAAYPGRVIAATFDHGLRAASADEGRMVARACGAIGVRHQVLGPPFPIVGGSIQAQARAARYAGLTRWAESTGAFALLTAHHADDQAETLLMRLNRASGIAGLAAIRPWRVAGAVLVLRPLLGWRRAELRRIVSASGLPFVDDPANDDLHHDRTRFRAMLAANPLLDAAALATSVAYLSEAEEVLRGYMAAVWKDRWSGPDHPFVLHDLPRELRRRLLRKAVAETRVARGVALPPFGDGSNVEAVLDAIEAGRTSTLAGVMIVRDGTGWTFRAAPPRRAR